MVIGYTDRDEAFAELGNVEISGAYSPADLSSIVEDSGCTTALFLSVWPETFSYTLSEAWRLGLHPITLDIGAPAERIREMQQGSLIPYTQNPREIMEALMTELNSFQHIGYDSAFMAQVAPSECTRTLNQPIAHKTE